MEHSLFRPNRRHAIQALGALISGQAIAQPTAQRAGAIKLMVGYAAGGGADVLARLLTQHLSQALDQPVVVDNRPGAGGTLAASALVNAPADGSVLYMAESAVLAAPAIYDKINYDPTTLTAVGALAQIPFTVVVHPDFPARNVAELISVLKASPGKYAYASPGVGNIAHLSAEMFKRAANVDMLHVPYKGGAPALADLIAGQIPICFVSMPPVLPLAKAQKLRVLGVTTTTRSEIAKDVPTIAETLPGFNAAANSFILAPPKTPPEIVTRLNTAFRAVMALPEVQREYAAQGVTVRTGTPQELAAQIRSELKTWDTVARGAGIRASLS